MMFLWMLFLREEEWKGEKTGWREEETKEPKQEEKEGRKRNRVKENQRQPQSQMTVGSLGGGLLQASAGRPSRAQVPRSADGPLSVRAQSF